VVTETARLAAGAALFVALTLALGLTLMTPDPRVVNTPPAGFESMPRVDGVLVKVEKDELSVRDARGRTRTLRIEDEHALGFDLGHLRLHAHDRTPTRVYHERGTARWTIDAPLR
jgi:hypothetical protein